MSKLSSAVTFLSKIFNGIFSKESVEELINKDKISFEAAATVLSAMPEKLRSAEANVEHVDMDNGQKTDIAKKAIQCYFEDVKFKAMLDAIQDDDTLLATEFKNIDNARTRIKAEIVKKYEDNYNTLLNEIKTTGGTNKEILDKLIQTKVSVDDAENVTKFNL